MGGYGSGRRWGSKNTTADYLGLDVRLLQRKGCLVGGCNSTVTWSRNGETFASLKVRAEESRVTLSYRHSRNGEPWKSEEYSVELRWTRCNYGGTRVWFVCPAVGCTRRVAILYGGGIFACRQCYQLVYQSQREQPSDRALRRAQEIRMKLGGSGSMADMFPWKPKGMHWRTYERLVDEAEQANASSWPPWLVRRLSKRLNRH
jgi:hypothetical protein